MSSQGNGHFFTGLERLNQESDDEDSFAPLKTGGTSRSFLAPSQTSKKRKATSDTPTMPSPSIPPSSSDPGQPVAASTQLGKKSKKTPPLKRAQSAPTGRGQGRKAKDKKPEVVPESEHIFRDLTFFFVPNDDHHSIRKIRINKAVARGARWTRTCSSEVTHIIVDADLAITEAVKDLPERKIPPNIPIIRDTWLVECFANTSLSDFMASRFRLAGMGSPFDLIQEEQTVEAEVNPQEPGADSGDVGGRVSISNSVQTASTDDAPGDDLDQAVHLVQKLGQLDFKEFLDADNPETEGPPEAFEPSESFSAQKEQFLCMQKNDGTSSSPNIQLTFVFQQLVNYYERVGDNWRTFTYRKAVTSLRRHPDLIRTREEALVIWGIGSSLADKIEEILTTGRLRKLDATQADPEEKVLILFMGVYGAGLKQARAWINQGHRTLEELQQNPDLTPNQKIGIEHYDDFHTRVPRQEVEEHAHVVSKVLKSVDPGLMMEICGSHRRGSEDPGDIDLLITKHGAPLEVIRTIMTASVIPELKRIGFLTAELATSHSREDGSKWHGASVLPGSLVWRRLDLLLVPWDELGAALIYFTGNDIFNRSIRFLAGKKGMRLNQHGLYQDVMRGKGREQLTEGKLLEGKSETRMFELLGVPYRPPEHRKP